MLAFYIFAYMAISFRLIVLIFHYVDSSGFYIIDTVQPGAKICAGLLQVWMIVEITLHLRNENRGPEARDR